MSDDPENRATAEEVVSQAFNLGRVVAAGRNLQGLTQSEMAEKLGIHPRTLALLEAGRAHNMSVTTVLKALSLVGYKLTLTPAQTLPPGRQIAMKAAVEGELKAQRTKLNPGKGDPD